MSSALKTLSLQQKKDLGEIVAKLGKFTTSLYLAEVTGITLQKAECCYQMLLTEYRKQVTLTLIK